MQPYAYNPSGASGLAQFMPGTYWAYAARIGERRSYWNPYAAANVMAFMFSRGQAYQWSCN
jgi:soluble lytic murein transglycosylase-like protein